MITTFAVLYTKPEWNMTSAIEHISKFCGKVQLGCCENDKCFCFTIDENKDGYSTNFLPLSDSVGLIVRDLELPKEEEEEKKEEEKKEEEKKE